MTAKLTLGEFVGRARRVHGDRYDYSRTRYEGMHSAVLIRCRIHGVFALQAGLHVYNASGCPKCAGVYSPSTAEWIRKARAVHGDRYDYSLVWYRGNRFDVRIICRVHGEFSKKPRSHVQAGRGCWRCAGWYSPDTEEWVDRARKVHGDRYDYSQTEYTGAVANVTIVCPVHGPFRQTAADHVKGRGCASCANNELLSVDEWVVHAHAVHGDRYDYSMVEYRGCSAKVTVCAGRTASSQ